MAKGTVNKVILLGRIGIKPEVRYMPSGTSVMTISLATNDGYKDKNTGEFIELTEWHRVNIFGQQAETIGKYSKKGDLLYVEGRIRTNKYQDKTTGQDRYSTEIVAIQIQMIGNKSRDQELPLNGYNASSPNTSSNNYSNQNFNKNKTNEKRRPNQCLSDLDNDDEDSPSSEIKTNISDISDDDLDNLPF